MDDQLAQPTIPEPSTLQKEIDTLANAVEQHRIAPLDLYGQLQKLVEQHIPLSRFDDYAKGGSEWQRAREDYIALTNLLLQAQMHHIAHLMLQDWWSAMGIAQQQTGRQYPLSIPSQLLTWIFMAVGDYGVAYRWCLLTRAHDVQQGQMQGSAVHQLRTLFGLNEQASRCLDAIGQACAVQAAADWSQPCGFPEEVIRRFTQDVSASDVHTALVAHHATRQDFPLSQGYLLAQLEYMAHIPNEEQYHKQKGDCLEAVAGYLLSLLPGCVIRSKVLSTDKAFESDILVANVYTQPTIISDLFGRYILVECKNYAKPVDVSRVGYFLHRMRMVHAKFGIMFASSDVTGHASPEEIAARSLIRRAFHEDGSTCIVIRRSELEQLATDSGSFYWLLHSKYEESRFGVPQ